MKKSVNTLFATAVLATGALLLNSSDALAQGRTRVGLKSGLNASSLVYDSQGAPYKNERIGFHAGILPRHLLVIFLPFSLSCST